MSLRIAFSALLLGFTVVVRLVLFVNACTYADADTTPSPSGGAPVAIVAGATT